MCLFSNKLLPERFLLSISVSFPFFLTCQLLQYLKLPLGGANFLVCKQWRQRFAVVEKNVNVIFTMAEAGWGGQCVKRRRNRQSYSSLAICAEPKKWPSTPARLEKRTQNAARGPLCTPREANPRRIQPPPRPQPTKMAINLDVETV